ncbi:demethoxyubiquinone hydroxylase family protein [Chloroflexota bacterium]
MAYDISVIRPQINIDDVKMRDKKIPPEILNKIKKALLDLHCLEITATNIYRYQITKERSEHNRQLIAAMCNEMTHYQDFQLKLFEYGWRPKVLRLVYWFVGYFIGFTSRMMGRRAVLKAGIWVETKAVREYARLLKEVEWDEDTRKVIEKDQADEHGHIKRWQNLLKSI